MTLLPSFRYVNEYRNINKYLFSADTKPFCLKLYFCAPFLLAASRIPLSIGGSDHCSVILTLFPSQKQKIINRGTAGNAAWGACNAVVVVQSILRLRFFPLGNVHRFLQMQPNETSRERVCAAVNTCTHTKSRVGVSLCVCAQTYGCSLGLTVGRIPKSKSEST